VGKMDLKNQCLEKLKLGLLGLAIKLVEDNNLSVDQDLREAAVEACIVSLKRHFHWIIPIFVSVFEIAEESEMNQFAAKLLCKALETNDYSLAVMVGRTFNIKLSPSIEKLAAEMVLAVIDKQAEQLGAIVMDNGPYEYHFNFEE
jgi:hypothetical protein